jgi:hypothetical protein
VWWPGIDKDEEGKFREYNAMDAKWSLKEYRAPSVKSTTMPERP